MTAPTRPMIHCILGQGGSPLALPAGMRTIAKEGVVAVVSDVTPELVRAADRPALQTFAELTAGLHRTANLIPMRYGCVLASDAAVSRLLEVRRNRLCALLARLDGCVELGIRLLLPATAPGAPESGAEPSADRATEPQAPRPGHAHLAEVRRRLQGETRVAVQAKAARAAIETAVLGLFRDVGEEQGEIGGQHLLSLYYLVPRAACTDFVEALRRAPDPINDPSDDPSDCPCLVTGPWPPYNFVGAIDDDLRCLA
jgi:hypothetical protein